MIRFAHYSPNPWHQQFLRHLEGFEPVINKCDKHCEFIWCGSASLLDKAFPASIQYRKPIIAWVWDLPNIFPEHSARVHMYVNALRQCTKVIAASKFTQDVLNSYGIRATQAYFYADTRDLVAGQKTDQVIQISRFTPHKRFEVAQQATQALNVPLVNVGIVNDQEFYYYNRLQKEAGSNVTFKPDLPRDDMIKELQRSRVLVTSTIFEGWGLSPIEALLCDVPVIVSDLPVFREQYGDAVLYHNPDDPKSLESQLKTLLADDALQSQIVRDGREKIKEFTPERFAQRWQNELISL
jgi:glycosyltransferase involved in cell wall biosynthesis